MVVEVRQAQGVGHDVQLEFAQLGQHVLREDQGIHRREGIGITQTLAGVADEAGVKIRIMGHQHPPADEFQKLGQHPGELGRTHQHIRGDAGQLDDLGAEGHFRVHKCLEAVDLHPPLQDHRADLNNMVVAGAEAGGLQIEGHILVVKGHLLAAVDHDAVVHVVYIIPLAAIEDLDVFVRPRHLGLGGGLHGVRERLGHAMIRDGDGLVAPGGGLLHGGGGIRQGVHIAHGGVQVQLHPLALRGQILPLGQAAGHDGVGLEHHVVFKPILDQLALHPQHRADLDVFDDGLGLPGLQEAADPDGIGVVRHVELHNIGIALGQLLVIHGEYLALQDDGAHVHGHILHGDGVAPEGLAVEGAAVLLLLTGGGGGLPGLGGGIAFDLRLTHGLHGVQQGLALQGRVCLHGDGHRGGEALPQGLLHRRDQLLNGRLAVGPQPHRQVIPLPVPFGPGQGAAGHGVAADKQQHQLLRLDFLQLGLRVGQGDLQPCQAVQRRHLPLHGLHDPAGHIALAVGRHMDGAVLRMDIRRHNGRLGEGFLNLPRRRIVRKHIQ